VTETVPVRASATYQNRVAAAALIAVAAAGIAVLGALLSAGDRASTCGSDFLNFYTGGKLAFSGNIYSPGAEARIQSQLMGCGPSWEQFCRLPYFAGLLWPFAQLPFAAALAVWRCICVAAVLVFIWMWPGPRPVTLAVCGWSFPLMVAFAYGQDVPILLLAAGAGIALLGTRRDFAAGLCLAMGAAKPHLFVILVLVILVRRRWRAVAGLAAGGFVLAAGCFLAGGFRWPLDFWRTVRGPAGSPRPSTMINLHGAILALRAPWWMEAALAIAFLALIVWACSQVPLQPGLALALAGGVLLGGHSYLYDLVFLIPLLLTVLSWPGVARWLKWAAAFSASPVLYLTPISIPSPGLAHFLLPVFLILTSLAIYLARGRCMRLALRQRTARAGDG